MLRYSRLSDAQILDRVLKVCEAEKVEYDDQGLEAIVFTAEGDMRQVSTALYSNFGTWEIDGMVVVFLGIGKNKNIALQYQIATVRVPSGYTM